MKYIDRNNEGEITGVYDRKQHPEQESVDDANADLLNYKLQAVIAAKITALDESAATVITGGIESDALGTTHRYDSTLTDQTNLNTAVALNVDINFQCDDLQGNAGSKVSRLHTAAQLKQVQLDAATFVQTQLATVRALKADVLAIIADDVTYPDYDSKKAAIEAVVWS